MKIRYVLLLLVGLLLMPDVYSNVFYVSPIGNDVANSGTKISPFASVMWAQQVVEAGDTVYFRGGKGLFNKLCQKRENHYIYPIKTSLNEQDRRI